MSSQTQDERVPCGMLTSLRFELNLGSIFSAVVKWLFRPGRRKPAWLFIVIHVRCSDSEVAEKQQKRWLFQQLLDFDRESDSTHETSVNQAMAA